MLDRWFYLSVALIVTVGFFFANFCAFVPAHGGVDQNGYLVGGRALARTWTMKYAPLRPGSKEFDPHQFVAHSAQRMRASAQREPCPRPPPASRVSVATGEEGRPR